MDDRPQRDAAPQWPDPPQPSEAELLAALEESEAQIAAGRTVPASNVHADLKASIERIRARKRQGAATARR
jgi:hypothetical protein